MTKVNTIKMLSPICLNPLDQQVTSDNDLDQLALGMTPAKKRNTTKHFLY